MESFKRIMQVDLFKYDNDMITIFEKKRLDLIVSAPICLYMFSAVFLVNHCLFVSGNKNYEKLTHSYS